FNIVRPQYAIFGEKDYQQLVAIRRLVKDLDLDVDVLGMPIVREPDGLAMSSRNAYLSKEERKAALSIYRALQSAKELYDKGERTNRVLLKEVKRIIELEPMLKPEYGKVVDIQTMEDIESAGKEALLAISARVGNTRLIDNIVLRKQN
ncbi:MAG: pantoate--beta-alanine ligase, partial [Deltaproteobacteria bacterium]